MTIKADAAADFREMTAPHEVDSGVAPAAPALAKRDNEVNMIEQLSREVLTQPHIVDGARAQLLATMPVNERKLQLAGISTSVLEGGKGPPMILLHGPLGCAAHWMGVIPELVGMFHVIAPDLPGHGASAAPANIDAPLLLMWLDELIQQTCPVPPVLVGQTLGGAIAARFAIGTKRLLGRLVLVDALGLSSFEPAPQFGRALQDFLTQPTGNSHAELWRYCAFDVDLLRQRMGKVWESFETYNVARASEPSVQAAVARLMDEFGLHAIAPDELAKIEVPAILIWGRHDLATSLSVAESASRRFGWPLHVIENCADDPPVEQPKALAQALLAAIGH